MLLHQPFSDYYGAWHALEDLYEEGKLRAIGVSNFYPDRLVDICSFAWIKPMVNQVETHPLNQQIEVWAPFGEGRGGLFQNEVLAAIGAKYGKSTTQVMLRWHIQRGVVIIPKSTHFERMVDNFNVFDFALTDEDMAAICGGSRTATYKTSGILIDGIAMKVGHPAQKACLRCRSIFYLPKYNAFMLSGMEWNIISTTVSASVILSCISHS